MSASGVTHQLTGDDPQKAAVTFAADHAHPVGTTAAPAPSPGNGTPANKIRTRKPAARRAGGSGILDRFPPPVRPVIKWETAAFVVVLVVLVVLAVIKGPTGGADPTVGQQDHPIPPAGTLYTVTAPPGWSQTATWTISLAHGTTPDTDPDTGATAALTPDDRTTAQTAHDTADQIQAHQPNYLSVLNPDGSTRYTAPLATRPVYGPVIITVDGMKVVLLQTNWTTVSYWPVERGGPVTVELPDQVAGPLNTAGPSVMVPLNDQRVAYVHNHAWQTLETLPLTTPQFATDGAVVSVQPETGAWWTQRIDAAPTSIKPARPASAIGLDQIMAVTPHHALLSWKTAPTAGSYTASDIIAAYDTATGKLLAETSSIATLSPSRNSNLTTPAGKAAALTLMPGLQVTAVYDAVYGQQ